MALSLKLLRDTIQKDASQNNMSPGQQAMMNAAKLATPPGAQTPMMPIQQNLDAAVSEEQQQMEAEKLEQERRKELDKKDQEISTMRSDLEMARLELEREKIRAEQKEREMQMKADIQKNELAAADKLKKEQRELEKRQNQFEVAEAKHQAQLEKATAQEQAKIEQSKSQALIDIAKTNADSYVKTTEEAKRNADAYFDEQRKALDEARSGLSPALRSQLTSAISALKGIGKTKANSNPVMQKLAAKTPIYTPPKPIQPMRTATSTSSTVTKPTQTMRITQPTRAPQYAQPKRTTTALAPGQLDPNDPNFYNKFNERSKFMRTMQNSSASELAKMQARTRNHISRLQGERNAQNDAWTEDQVNMYADRLAMMGSAENAAVTHLDKQIQKGDQDAWEEKFRRDNLYKRRYVDRSGIFTGLHQLFSPSTAPAMRSDLDLMENAYADRKAYEARSDWAGLAKPIVQWLDTGQNAVTDSLNDVVQAYVDAEYVKDMYNRAGVVQDWFGSGSAAPDRRIQAVTGELDNRGLKHSTMGNWANKFGQLGNVYLAGRFPKMTFHSPLWLPFIADSNDPKNRIPWDMQEDYTYDRYMPSNKWQALTKQSNFNPNRQNMNMSGASMGYNPNRPWWAGVLDMASPYISAFTGNLINFSHQNTPQMNATAKPMDTQKAVNYALRNAFEHRTPRNDGYHNDMAKLFNYQYNKSHGLQERPEIVYNPLTAL